MEAWEFQGIDWTRYKKVGHVEIMSILTAAFKSLGQNKWVKVKATKRHFDWKELMQIKDCLLIFDFVIVVGNYFIQSAIKLYDQKP